MSTVITLPNNDVDVFSPPASILPNTYSLEFDGVDEYCSGSDDPSLDIAGDVSFSAWVKITNTSTVRTILAKWQTGGNQRSYSFSITGNENVRMAISNNGSATEVETSTGTVPTGVWTHVGVTWKASTSTYRFFINGAFDSQDVGSMTSIFSGTAPITVGGQGAAFFFAGFLDEVSIWNKTLADAEMASIYNSGVPIDLNGVSGDYVSPTNLVSWWRMGDGATYPTIPDTASSNNNSVVMQNMEMGDIVEDAP